jgi:hypothetical protein
MNRSGSLSVLFFFDGNISRIPKRRFFEHLSRFVKESFWLARLNTRSHVIFAVLCLHTSAAAAAAAASYSFSLIIISIFCFSFSLGGGRNKL